MKFGALIALALYAVVESTEGAGTCARDEDCMLNGVCDALSGVCACDSGWTGTTCGRLAFEPVASRAAPGFIETNFSSWGGSVVPDPDDGGLWHMFSARMAGHCGLGAWDSKLGLCPLLVVGRDARTRRAVSSLLVVGRDARTRRAASSLLVVGRDARTRRAASYLLVVVETPEPDAPRPLSYQTHGTRTRRSCAPSRAAARSAPFRTPRCGTEGGSCRGAAVLRATRWRRGHRSALPAPPFAPSWHL